MAGVTRLVLALQEISLPGDLPGECDLGLALKEFFERTDIQSLMVKMNQSQLYDMQESRYGTILGTYADKTMKHKIRVGLPTPNYTYYETGKTHESLTVYADEESVGIFPDHESAPEYAHFALNGDAWGLNNENFDELMPEIKEAVTNQIRDFLRNG
jgi:hypothetical protein